MYVSDYSFSANPSSWTTTLFNYNGTIRTVNWMYMGASEWTLCRDSDIAYMAFHLYRDGSVYTERASGIFSIRPVFFLKDDVIYVNGSGLITDPIRIN